MVAGKKARMSEMSLPLPRNEAYAKKNARSMTIPNVSPENTPFSVASIELMGILYVRLN